MSNDATGNSAHQEASLAGVINPRLSDGHDVVVVQEDVDFLIPHLQEDLPLSIDPFLMWYSNKQEYQQLHSEILDFIDVVRRAALNRQDKMALSLLLGVEEPAELGLGYAQGTRRGSAIGLGLASAIIGTFRETPQLADEPLSHLETMALLVPRIAEDRISDIVACVSKRWLATFTTEWCNRLEIPLRRYRLNSAWDADAKAWRPLDALLPWNPLDGSPVMLTPLVLLRRLPWINYSDYYRTTYSRLVLPPNKRDRQVSKEAVLLHNRRNFQVVEEYVEFKELDAARCRPDPLFSPLSVGTLVKRLSELEKLNTGKDGGADKRFESIASDLMSSLFYPELDLAAKQSRTYSGAHIRDLIFHNDAKTNFLSEIRRDHAARQLVFELKNVAELGTDHVNQLYRYLDDEHIGRLGVLVGRKPASRNVIRNTIDLYHSKKCIVLCFGDAELRLMLDLKRSGRTPIDVMRKKYIEFLRQLPS